MKYPEDKRAMFASEMAKKQLLEQMISFDLINKLGNEMKINETEEYKANLAQLEKDLITQVTINKILEFIENWHLSLKATRDLSFYSKLNSINSTPLIFLTTGLVAIYPLFSAATFNCSLFVFNVSKLAF